MTKTVLILGASGRFGRNAEQAFENAGWTVRNFNRETDTLRQAVHGVQVIVNAWNPPYYDWAQQVPRLHDDVIAAARIVDATVIIPGNVYVYGMDNGGTWDVTTPHRAQNALGMVRRTMEQAYRESGVRTIILRAGDFLDTEASGNWFDMIMAPKLAKGVFTYPGATNLDHAWAYLPDLCRAAVELAENRDKLNRFEDVPFPGYTLTGEAMVDRLSATTGRDIKLKTMNWLPIQIARPFWKLAPHLLEMRYLWNMPHRLSSSRFDELLPDFQHTPIEKALASAVPPEALLHTRDQKLMSIQTSL
ncbi:dTDP-4-dehydrorhamnose reductase [Shimia isoporae]|uniref:dTDP-4-dehydrorhamnose reductase n=1 Tax=Shimia isoporae TaxID=647720 RepID=A0A4R1N8B1_9RHOB|nr:epimerase [Shimia isoporae]TCL01344.1 dTDP-4-dehydrorhamnose reductase [Shimia isoporae]